MSMRAPAVAAAVSLALAAAASASIGDPSRPSTDSPAVTAGKPVFVLTGSGYGHGVGLSQFGAFAQAQAGRSMEQILAFYYPGTELGTAPVRKLRVLLAPAAKSLTVTSPGTITLRDAAGATHVLPGGKVVLGPELRVPVDGVETPLSGPLSLSAQPGQLLWLGDKPYRGTLQISSLAGALQVIDLIGLEAYLLGVVPGEIPSTWPAAALQAQAVAARSYALVRLVKGKQWDLFPDTRSQLYLGAGAETAAATAAVRATAGRVLRYDGKVAIAFYSSSNGGRSESALDGFGLDLPYLPSQADPWDEVSPNHVWPPVSYTGAQLAKAFKLPSPVVDVQSQLTGSGRVRTLTLTAADGLSLGVTGTEARRRLTLRSTAFRLGTLRFLTPPMPISPGVGLRLTGVARDVDGAMLERLRSDRTWTPIVKRLRTAADGTFAKRLHPRKTTTYRLSASGVAGPALTIPVVPGPNG
jgi:stage II sporulation protein D